MKKFTTFEELKGIRGIQGNVYFDIIIFSCLSLSYNDFQVFLNLFCLENKRLLSDFLRKQGWTRNEQGLWTTIKWSRIDYNNINIILLWKEKTWKLIFITNSELSQNHPEKQFLTFKTTIIFLFNDIWCF